MTAYRAMKSNYNYKKAAELRKQRSEIYKQILDEDDNKKRQKLQLKMKMIEIKIELENLKR